MDLAVASFQIGAFTVVKHSSEPPLPEVNQVTPSVFCDLTEGWLDMRTFPGNARLALPKWPNINAGQRLWVLARGNEYQVKNYRFEWVLEDHVVTAEEAENESDFKLELSRHWLAGCEEWSCVTLMVAVTLDGAPGTPPVDPKISLLPENALELLHATANLRVIEIEESDDFENYPVKEYLGPGSIIETRLLKFELPEDSIKGIGLHVVRTDAEITPGMLEGNALALCCGKPISALRKARLVLKWKCSRIRFAYATTGEGATFRFIGEGDLLLEERWVTSRTWVHFHDVQCRPVCRVEVESLEHGSIDNLTVKHRGKLNPM